MTAPARRRPSSRRLAILASGLALSCAFAMAQPLVAGANGDWRALTPAQRSALAPLQSQWAQIDGPRREKWIEVANRFPTMPPEEQARLQARMAAWSHMTPRERGQARVQFQEAQRWSPEARQERWAEYQSLHPEARQVLAERWKLEAAARAAQHSAPSSAKRNVVEPVPAPAVPSKPASPTTVRAQSGATSTLISAKPSPPVVNQAGVPKIAATETFVDPATLLPRRGPQAAAVVPVPKAADKTR